MNENFPRIITLLRKEKGLSQKQAATELGISQALLSHYERGIRECGLDFLVRVAKYYNVSCDYLVGMTPNREGTILKLNEMSETTEYSEVSDIDCRNSILPMFNKKLIINSIYIIFDILSQIGNKTLTNDVSSYLMVSIYKMFRLMYSINPQNPQGIFSVVTELHSGLSSALMLITETNVTIDLNTVFSKKHSKNKKIELSSKMIQDKYPQYSSALASLIQITEQHMKSLNG